MIFLNHKKKSKKFSIWIETRIISLMHVVNEIIQKTFEQTDEYYCTLKKFRFNFHHDDGRKERILSLSENVHLPASLEII